MYNPLKVWSTFTLTLAGEVQELPADGSTNVINRVYCSALGCQEFVLTAGTPSSLSYTASDKLETILRNGRGPVAARVCPGYIPSPPSASWR